MGEVPLSTPGLAQSNRKSQSHEFTGKLTSNSTTSYVVNGSNCRTQQLVEESRVDSKHLEGQEAGGRHGCRGDR